MGMLDAFNHMNEIRSFEQTNEEYHQQPVAEWDKPMDDPHVWLDRYQQFSERPKFNPNMDGYISPYSSNHWGASSEIMQAIAGAAELGPIQEKLDPNKIFTSDIAALKTIAADQQKLIKLFEKKAIEMYTDKGSFGLNEDAIAAMQALNSARSTLMQIQEKQINVKKSIAELKIKQQQAGQTANTQTAQTPGRPTNAFDVGRSIMDSIFDIQPQSTIVDVPANANYPTMDLDQAANVLNEIVDTSSVSTATTYEADKPTTYVVVGKDDASAEFVTYSASGEILPDYPNPTSKINTIDRDGRNAVDEFLVSYPVKFKDE